MAVQGTNDSSTLSKSSASRAGYFSDDFISCFSGKQSRRSSLIHRGYSVRVLAVDRIIQQFLTFAEGTAQIVSFGAGFDSTYFRLTSKGSLVNVVYIEVDFPDVVRRKVSMIREQKKLSDMLVDGLEDKHGMYISPKYSLIGLDLEHVARLSYLLPQCGVDIERPTLLLSECVLTYINDKSANRIINWSAVTFPNAVFITYEQVYPEDGFGRVMQNHFSRIGSPLKCINAYPSPQAQEERYVKMGWECSRARDMHYFYYHFQSEEERRRISRLELFDEFEEFHMKCSHYVIVCSVKGKSLDFLKHLNIVGPCEPSAEDYSNKHCLQVHAVPLTVHPVESSRLIQRYGQTCVWMCERSTLLVCGGFGHGEHTHGRLCDTIETTVTDDSVKLQKCHIKGDPPDKLMYTSLVLLSNHSCVLFGGRGSPSQVNDRCYLITSVDGAVWEWIAMVTKEDVSPEGRYRHTASVVMNSRGEEVMIVFGGRNVRGESLSDFWCLNFTSLIWTKLDCVGDIPSGCHSSSSAVWENKMLLYGGLDRDDIPLSSLYITALKEKDGVPHLECKELNLVPPLPARYSCCGIVHDSHFVLVGGVSWNCNSPHIIIIDLKELKWTSVRVRVDEAPLLMYGVSAFVVPDKGGPEEVKLVVMNGGGNCFSFGTHFNPLPYAITLNYKFT